MGFSFQPLRSYSDFVLTFFKTLMEAKGYYEIQLTKETHFVFLLLFLFLLGSINRNADFLRYLKNITNIKYLDIAYAFIRIYIMSIHLIASTFIHASLQCYRIKKKTRLKYGGLFCHTKRLKILLIHANIIALRICMCLWPHFQ